MHDFVGALLLAEPRDGKLVYIGRVGTGFNDEQLRELRKKLSNFIIDEAPTRRPAGVPVLPVVMRSPVRK